MGLLGYVLKAGNLSLDRLDCRKSHFQSMSRLVSLSPSLLQCASLAAFSRGLGYTFTDKHGNLRRITTRGGLSWGDGHSLVMALFSDELFEVFEEEPEKPSSKAKKRRRNGDGGSGPAGQERDEQKKAKVEGTALPAAPGASLTPHMTEDEPFPDETDAKET